MSPEAAARIAAGGRFGRIARARWTLALRQLLRGRGRARGAAGPAGIVLGLLLATLIGGGLRALFHWLAAQGATAGDAATLLGLAFTATATGLLVFDLQEGVAVLVADSDLELLRRAPLTARAMLLIKLADALPRTTLLVVTLALPSAWAYLITWPPAPWGWPLGLLVVLALWVIPVGFGAGLAIDLLRVVPARRAREMLAMLSTLTLTLLWIGNAFLVPRLDDPAALLTARAREGLAHAPWPVALSPGTWAARALAAASERRPLAAAAIALALLGVAALGALFAAWRAARRLEEVQARIAVAPSAPATAGGAGHGLRGHGGGFTATVIARDARLFLRDWTVAGDVITAAALWTLLPLVTAPLHAAPGAAIAGAMLLALTVGLGYEIAARAWPFERSGLAWLALAPVGAGRWVAARFVGTAALALPLLAVACVGVALAVPLTWLEWARTLCVVLPALGLALSLGLWTGAVFGDPEWTHPRAMLSLQGRLIAALGLLAQAAIWLALAVWLQGRPPIAALILPWLIAAAPIALALNRTTRALARTEWPRTMSA